MVLASRADSKWKSIFMNIYSVFEVGFFMKVKNELIPFLFTLFVFKWYQYVWEFSVSSPSLTSTTTMTA